MSLDEMDGGRKMSSDVNGRKVSQEFDGRKTSNELNGRKMSQEVSSDRKMSQEIGSGRKMSQDLNGMEGTEVMAVLNAPASETYFNAFICDLSSLENPSRERWFLLRNHYIINHVFAWCKPVFIVCIRSSDKLFRKHDFFSEKIIVGPMKVSLRLLWLRWS